MSKEKKDNSKRITIRIEEKHIEKLSELMQENNSNVSALLREALESYFDKIEKQKTWLKLVPIK